jgi:predicted RNase H-like HicB family nuclease
MPEKLKKLNRRVFFGRLRGKKEYLFTVEVQMDDCGNWEAWIEALPECTARGYSEEEALQALQQKAQQYIEAMMEKGQAVPVDKAVQTESDRVITIAV